MTQWTLSRRTVMAGMVASIACPATAARTIALIAGGYASGGGKGVYPITYDPRRDHWQVGPPIADTADASFGLGGGPAGAYYLMRERSAGTVSTHAPDWAERGAASTLGADPCHAALDAASACLAVANYSSGNIAFFRLDPRTGVAAAGTAFAHAGSGPRTDRQQRPHAHWVGFTPDRRWLHAVDLGADAIFAYRFDPARRRLTPAGTAWPAPAGAGPRHMVHHPRLARSYVVCELSNTLVTLDRRPDGRLTTRRTDPTLPGGSTGPSQAAHIAIDRAGRTLYLSNRGHDSIAVFALDAAGVPSLRQHVASGGRWPRFFLMLEAQNRLVVGNERSGTVAVFRVARDGRLTDEGTRLAVPGVAFIDGLR